MNAPVAPLPTSHQAVDALIDEARRRQDGLVTQVRALADDSRALDARLKDLTGAAPEASPGLLASLGQRLRRRRKDRSDVVHGEAALRQRVEAALQETKKASWLADRFGALRQELDDELDLLHALSRRAATDTDELERQMVSARVIADDESVADVERDAARRERAGAERQARVLAQLVERLAVLLASARGVIDVVDALHDDVAGFARAAATLTDALSARARAVGVAEDARAVLQELEGALSTLGGTLDEAAIFATAVSERITQTPSMDPAFQQSLETLVKGALARRSATAAVEKAATVGDGPSSSSPSPPSSSSSSSPARSSSRRRR